MSMTDTTIAAPRSVAIDPKFTRNKGGKGNFEMLAWLFMRLSGVILVVLLAIHLTANLMVGQGVQGIDFGFVAGKWANPMWQFFDLTLLWLAMLHGTNGMRTIIMDYAQKDSTRFWLSMILYIASASILILGTLVIFTFEPCMVDGAGNLLPSVPEFCRA
ncbi:MAG: succinate dehydrogenase hydrophobic membrane anchor subunit [Micrococcus sp.]|nr:succinate dehydrogenase hydrophobic membrane anchor subunit [Micrococcus sp.]